MKAKLISTLTLLLLSGFSSAADETPTAKPQSGSATTDQESAAHPATGQLPTNDDKTGAATTIEQSATHPAATGKGSSDQAPSASGGNAVRNWTAIDTNHDNSISPDEMQKFLENEWANKKSS